LDKTLEDRRIEVTVEVGDKRVTLSGPEDFVRHEVRRLLGGEGTSQSDAKLGGTPQPSPGANFERDFVAAKCPRGHAETIAVLALALKNQGHDEFTPEDIRRAYIRASLRPPKSTAQGLRDAKNKHDFVESGSKKGLFRLSEHGERTALFDLPTEKERK
jgi:hypothetical protein